MSHRGIDVDKYLPEGMTVADLSDAEVKRIYDDIVQNELSTPAKTGESARKALHNPA